MTATAATQLKTHDESPSSRQRDRFNTSSHRHGEVSAFSGNSQDTRHFGTGQAFRIVPARAGDHHDIQALLVSVSHQPSATEFQAQLDDPFYEPNDRLLVKRDQQIVAHIRIANREMNFGKSLLPVSTLSDLAVLPEYRNEGCAVELVRAAEQAILAGGSRIAMLRTKHPEFYAQLGWTVGIRHSYSVAGARDILSQLQQVESPAANPLAPDAVPINIRMWRHVELAALTRLYSQCTNESFGPFARTDAYWHWLVSRRAYDSIYVAIEGPDKLELNDALTPIVGYAIVRRGRIAELVTAPGCEAAATALLSRACGDAIERDLHHVQLDAIPSESLHQIFAAADGRCCFDESDNGEVTMVKVFDPLQFLVDSFELLHERAKAADLNLPSDLGIIVDGQRYTISIRPRTVKLLQEKVGRSYLECDSNGLTQLLLGHFDVAEAVDAGRISASTRVAIETASFLFPKLPFWRPALDELQA